MIGIVTLAAGNSSRLGRPKQLLDYKNTSLINRIVSEAVSVTSQTVVVLGAYYEEIIPLIDGFRPHIVINKLWHNGMGSSVAAGVRAMMETYPAVDSVIISVADQPHVNADLFRELIKKRAVKGIVACEYDGTIGTPVLFDKKYFPEIVKLNGQEGAKKVVLQNIDDVTTVAFPLGSIDVDTEQDYQHLISKT